MVQVARVLPGHFGKSTLITRGNGMSVEIETGVVDLDANTAAWLEQYKSALAKIKELNEVADVARAHIEIALGDCELGMFLNRPVVRWTKVESKRFDTKRAREILPAQVIDALEVVSVSRRFSIVQEDD
jgi:predicted phage-related endonuclease